MACVSETGDAGACADGTALQTPFAIAASPDGLSVYVGVDTSDAIAIFDRDPASGAITQKPGADGCWSETGASGCADGVALDFPRTVAVSPDGRNVYVAAFSSNAVAVFERDPLTGA
jgi:DNA-binding beta-propeller fold protein YncE